MDRPFWRIWLREPLVHFFILGLILLIGHGLWQRYVTRADYTIHVSASELQRQAEIFARENRRQPSDEDIKSLLFAHVEEQALSREAARLDLGEDDTIIRRRLAQKMRFMLEDSHIMPSPPQEELEGWYEANKALFTRPETRSFSHIFIRPDGSEAELSKKAEQLRARANDESWRGLGDPFIENRLYENVNQSDVRRVMGSRFAQDLFALGGPSPVWQGPIPSALGLHLVRLDKITPEAEPSFDEISSEILARWQEETQRAENLRALERTVKKYKVKVDEDME